MARAREVLDQALSLSTKDRARIAHELIVSLDDAPVDDPAEVERAWTQEIERRLEEVDAGTAQLVPWNVAEREIKSDLAKARRLRARKTRRKRAR
jgi:putative addiction module component (TIGR02574 family)